MEISEVWYVGWISRWTYASRWRLKFFTLGAAAMAGKEDRTVDCGEAGGVGDVVSYVM